VWERGFNLGVFTHVHLREREGGREREDQLGCGCASREDVLRSELIGPIYRQFA